MVLDRERSGAGGDHRITVAEFLESWLAAKALSRRATTIRSYGEHVRLYLVPSLGRLRLLDLRPHHVERMYGAMRTLGTGSATSPEAKAMLAQRTHLQRLTMRPLSPASIRRVHATLMSALNTAAKQRLIPYNPAAHVELAPTTRPNLTVWSPQQIGAFLDATAGERLAPLFHVAAMVGLRRGELVGLTWVDVDLDAATLRVAQQVVQLGHATAVQAPKTKSGERVVQLDLETVAVLRAWKAQQARERLAWGAAWVDTGRVFTRENGEGLHPERVTRAFQALARRHGLPVIRLHDLRHGSASWGLASGESLVEVSRRLGHSSLSFTADTYVSVLPVTASESSERRAAFIPRMSREQSA